MVYDTLSNQDTDFTGLIGGPQPHHHGDSLVHHMPWLLRSPRRETSTLPKPWDPGPFRVGGCPTNSLPANDCEPHLEGAVSLTNSNKLEKAPHPIWKESRWPGLGRIPLQEQFLDVASLMPNSSGQGPGAPRQ